MKVPVTDLREKVLRVISDRNISNPITGAAIGELVGTDWRSVALCIEMLRFNGFKIGASKSKPMGYFLARTPEEMRETSERIRQGCLVQLRMLKHINTWNGNTPTLWEGDALHFIQQTIAEAETLT